MLRDTTSNAATSPDPFVTRAFAQMSDIDRIALFDSRGRLRWSLGAPAAPPDRGVGYLREPFVVTRLPVSDVTTGETIGSVEARLSPRPSSRNRDGRIARRARDGDSNPRW